MSQTASAAQQEQQGSKAEHVPGKFSAGTVFLLVLAAVALYFSYLIARPFLTPIFVALMIAVVFHPIHLRIESRIQSKNLAALTSMILVLVTIVVPTAILGTLVAREAHALYLTLSEKSFEQGGWSPYAMHFVERSLGWAGRYVGISKLDVRGALIGSLEQISHALFSWGTHLLSNVVSFFVAAVIASFTLFFLFREGELMKRQLAASLPLRPDRFERLFSGISNSIVANVYGCVAVGLSQGILLSLGFWTLSLPSPILWGMVTALCSMIPFVGSAAVWVPAAIVLFAAGHWVKGLIMLAWGAALVAQIDNVVRPYVVSERANMHPLLMFFALLGGVQAFGPLGLFIGPVVISVTLVAVQMLREANLGSSEMETPHQAIRSENY